MSSPPCWTCRKGATKTRLKEFLRSTSQAPDQAEPHGFLFLTSGVITPSSGSLPDVCLGIHRCHPKNGPNCFPYVTLAQGRLYLITTTKFTISILQFLELPKSGTSAYSWQTLQFPTTPIAIGPRSHKGAGSLPITTGSYLFYFLGGKDASTSAQPKRNLRLSGVLMREMWYFG